MRYWILTTEFPPFYGGGISTYTDQTARMLSEAGHEVSVFIPYYESDSIRESLIGNIRIVQFNPKGTSTYPFFGYEANLSFAFAEAVTAQIRLHGKPDFIEAQEYLGIAYYLLQKKHLGYPELADIKVVITLHAPTFLYLDFNQVPVYKHPNFWTGEMERFCIRAADIRISPSAYLPFIIADRIKLDDLKIHVLPNPFESSYLNEPVPDYTSNEVVFFGKIIPQKGCIELIRYFSELWDEGFTVPLRMIGGGKHLFHPVNQDLVIFLKKKYKKYIDNGLLFMEGEIRPDELYMRLKNAHIILIPSIVDNLPYTVLEAMASGKVVLASRQGGQSEIISHEKDGFLFDHKEKGSFRRELKKILALDSQSIHEIGRLAKQKVRSVYNHPLIYKTKMSILEQSRVPAPSGIFPLIRPAQPPQETSVQEIPGLLSVVIPYYNMGIFLPQAIASIRASTHLSVEIIVVDDGSTETESIEALHVLENDARVRIIRKKNEGLPLARNTGALNAQGEFLAFLDPDDTIEPSYYPKALDVLRKKDNISFAGCWARYFDEGTGIWPTFNPEPPYVLLHNCLNTSALVYKKRHFIDAGLNDPAMIYGMEDYESMISMLAKGYRGVSLPEPLWNYRIRKNSMARAFTINSQLYLYKQIAEKHADFYSHYSTQLFMLLNSNGPSYNIDNPTYDRRIYSKFAQSWIGRNAISLAKKNNYVRILALGIYKRFVK
ncbi:MAG TPA: glycosyltransferase [Bacteroidia bacterium]|nr:glycosyltransferase [Bacteroidia bacterium]